MRLQNSSDNRKPRSNIYDSFWRNRTHVEWNHALIAPDGHVPGLPPGWGEAEGNVLISPAMRGGSGGPRFSQYLVRGGPGCRTTNAPEGVQRLVYILAGEATLDGTKLTTDSFAWLPPNFQHDLVAGEGSDLLVFEKRYTQLNSVPTPKPIIGSLSESHKEPFLGDPDAILATLLPVEPGFDMAVNVFTFNPGTPLPFVETHIMEHGLYMKQGQGVYRLSDQWYPVQAGDSIWMASYCPQWFVAMGKSPATYIYYKDIHRDPLEV